MSKTTQNRERVTHKARRLRLNFDEGTKKLLDVVNEVTNLGGDISSTVVDVSDEGWDCNSVYLSFVSPETDEEWQQRLKEIDQAEARVKEQAKWAARMRKAARVEEELVEYERLKAKYESNDKGTKKVSNE